MITCYQKQEHYIQVKKLAAKDLIPDDALWIDMQCPTEEELLAVARQLDIEIPSKTEIWKNHVLNRMYQENGVCYMTAAIITKVDCPYPETSAVTFILSGRYLLTLREIAPTSFQNFSHRLQRSPQRFPTSSYVLEGLMEEVITRVAHNSEVVTDMLDQLSHSIFDMRVMDHAAKKPSHLMKDVLNRLGLCNDLNSKINESVHSINRMLSYFKQIYPDDQDIDNNITILMTDTEALIKQTAFLSDKITFQLDATLGMINVEQNLIIKIFSVVAVFFLPPTLVSSMYGMNFQSMPELSWPYGYPMALILMLLCALVPYIYFRKKGWL